MCLEAPLIDVWNLRPAVSKGNTGPIVRPNVDS
jgi:hypothetical protein